MNNFLVLGAVVACGWAASNVVLLEPAARPVSSRPTTVAAPAYAFQPIVGRNIVEARRAPVPLIRNTRPPVVAPTSIDTLSVSADVLTVSAEQKAQDDRRRKTTLTGKRPRLRWKRTDTNVQPWLAKLATEVGGQRPTEARLKSGSRWMALEGCRWTEQPCFIKLAGRCVCEMTEPVGRTLTGLGCRYCGGSDRHLRLQGSRR